jgi:two-component system, sensor histidine kinase RegB
MTAAAHTTEHIERLDAVGLPWLVSVRWAGMLAQLGAVVAGTEGLAGAMTLTIQMGIIGVLAASNLWLSWRLSRRQPLKMSVGGWLVSADVVVLSWLLRESGAVLNPVSVFYLVDIVLAALVLDRVWAWIITTLSIAGYGMLFLAPSAELAAAGAMHPEIGEHVRGMWLAFAGTALIVAILVSRLASMIERRDRALAHLRERSARDARLASLTTLSAGAAHELSTPLATIAVAARELELALVRNGADAEWQADAQLIRSEVERCRHVLHDMSARLSQPIGEVAVAMPLRDVIDATTAQLGPASRHRRRTAPSRFAPPGHAMTG